MLPAAGTVMKLSLMIPTFNSAETIARTLGSALRQQHRPLEVVVYDEASTDRTRTIVAEMLATAPAGVETHLFTSDANSGPVRAWRVPLHAITGAWCAFVWADDVLHDDYSTKMMAGAARAAAAGRKLVACSGEVESAGETRPYYATDKGLATPVEYSEGIFMRRFPLTQICAIYETAAAREVFDRHVSFDNPRGYDYSRHPYGNDVGYLSELAMAGGGVELIGERLVTLVDSGSSMTRRGTREHVWQMRWQYTFNQLRVWRWWAERGVPGAERLRRMGERRLALCTLMLGDARERLDPRNLVRAVRAYAEFRRLDYQINRHSLDEHRRRVQA
jgi:glycosyltransferase involved in cell wall biosynthesis